MLQTKASEISARELQEILINLWHFDEITYITSTVVSAGNLQKICEIKILRTGLGTKTKLSSILLKHHEHIRTLSGIKKPITKKALLLGYKFGIRIL